MAKNVSKLYYPIKESIQSILPIVDEFVVALGDCDEDDKTREIINSINSPKIKIIDTKWDIEKFPDGMENAHQTDIAKETCSGDWLFYLQADEVVHEKYHETIKNRCKELLNNTEIEALLFNYIHFYGDYKHYLNSHGWYAQEIRIIRNNKDIHSFRSAQSFRRIPDFDGKSYRKKEGSIKLKVAKVDAYIYHYGWVRPPKFMQKKKKALDTIHKGKETVAEMYDKVPAEFDYGPLGRLPIFTTTHPKVMKTKISKFDWGKKLDYAKKSKKNRKLFKHEQLKYRLLTFVEQNILNKKQLFGNSNWEIINT